MEDETTGEEHEARIRAAWERGGYSEAAGLIVELYGSGILSFICDRVGSVSTAEEVFSDFTEKVLEGVPSLRWTGTARGWAYRVARNAAADYFRDPDRKPQRRLTLSNPHVAGIADQVRATTALHLRTDVKNRFRELRLRLPEEDQIVLVLRLDKSLSWEEIAGVTLAEGLPAPAALKAEAGRLRQRYKRVKDRLKQMAIVEGLLPE